MKTIRRVALTLFDLYCLAVCAWLIVTQLAPIVGALGFAAGVLFVYVVSLHYIPAPWDREDKTVIARGAVAAGLLLDLVAVGVVALAGVLW